ncbi:MAG: phosphoribosylformylglycinamidine synthase [Tissierellaceae bacterium]|nr:phosphoribosylformylglycinamidine synthase [Tissierellaceae bacterium]
MDSKRVYVEKDNNLCTESKKLLRDFRDYLGISNLEYVRVINVYDFVNVNDEEKNIAINSILNESAFYKISEEPPIEENEIAFRVELVKGQFNQREDSINILIKNFLLDEEKEVLHSKIIVVNNVSQQDIDKIKSYYINPIELKEVSLDSFNYEKESEEVKDVEIINGFIGFNEDEMKDFKYSYGIGMDMDDLLYCQKYFKEVGRDPYIVEIKLIDTYWSDHCRHTTFMTEITDIQIDEGKYKEVFEEAIKEYLSSRKFVYEDRDRAVSLMDLATINMKEIQKKGLLDDKEKSDEVNAASIEIDVDVDGKVERWLLMFKNETHNHPTEMEPFGGASTCLGGAIRDPLSGRSYVYQGMRISGAADPRQKFEDTLPGKLPQRKIAHQAMEGFTSYGNQIGAATGYIKEVYDKGYVAKRMECGALVAAAPKDWVYRGKSTPGDLIILVGGRTGRDGLGGAVGSSKQHTEESLHSSGAEVQKGNPPLERKIVRLFRKEEVSKMIKVCNDFGAGGVSVAIGELADGLMIDLDKVPLKYPGLDGSEIALSESQERMAVVIDSNDLDRFMEEAIKEDLEATVVAKVTDEKALKMNWRGQEIVNIERSFLDTNGIRKKIAARITQPSEKGYLQESSVDIDNIKDAFIDNMKDINIASQRGLAMNFDHTVGGGTVLMPYGGKYGLSPSEGMVAKIPVLRGNTNTCSIMTYGYEPEISKWSPFHGGYYAVIESLAKIVALGGDYRKARLSFQEYFERLGEDKSKWGKPLAALLGAYLVEKELDIPSIGGKDSMSGTFEDIDVPPTLVSFAVVSDKVQNIVSNEFKEADNNVVLIPLHIDENGLVDFNQLKSNYSKIKELVDKGIIKAAQTVKHGGIARTISEMSFGNMVGFKFEQIDKERLFKPLFGSIVLEIPRNLDLEKEFEGTEYEVLGTTNDSREIQIEDEKINLSELLNTWESPLNDVFPIKEQKVDFDIERQTKFKNININSNTKPKVLIPIFTGTHSEYTLTQRFEEAGGNVETFVFNTLSKESIEESYRVLAQKIDQSKIIAFPDGAVLGNEPESGGKLVRLILSNPYVKEAIDGHIRQRDGLILGIGNGFQGMLKSGLIDNGRVSPDEVRTFIENNQTGGFVSTLVDVEVKSNKSPWLSGMEVGDVYTVPLATYEGRIILSEDSDIRNNGQIATSFKGTNITGSEMNIESLTCQTGRIFGTLTAIDRIGEGLYKNMEIKGTHNIFESGIKYFG